MEVSCSDVRTLQLNIDADTSLKRETCTKFSPIVSSSSQIYYSRDEHILFMRQVGIMWKYEDKLRRPPQVSLATWTNKCDHDESAWWNTKGVCVKENRDTSTIMHVQHSSSLWQNDVIEGLVTWAVSIHMHGLSHGCSCVLSVPQQDLLRSCNGHASIPDYHATCKLRQDTKGKNSG